MNFVKGILRRSSQSSQQESQSSAQISSAPPPSWIDVQFSDGAEEVLNRLWQKYEGSPQKEKRQDALKEFLLEFNTVFERWVPLEEHQLEEKESHMVSGCIFGHPTRIILGISDELKSTSDFMAALHDSAESSMGANEMEAALRLLSTLSILTRSLHNRTVFSFYGGLHTLTALMKNAVVQTKGISAAVFPNILLLSFLQCLLTHVVSIMNNFIELEKQKKPETGFTLLLETGGLNWFVELLRVLRKLRLRGVVTDESLEKLILQTLKAATASSARAQNHFRSIGGLEALLDGLGSFPKSNTITDKRSLERLSDDFTMQVLSIEVIREAVFRNMNSLQSVKDMGGLQKFVEVFRWAAFSFPGLYMRFYGDETDTHNSASSSGVKVDDSDQLKAKDDILQNDENNEKPWNAKASRLCKVLCTFMVATGDIFSLNGKKEYSENATRFIVNVLLGVFRDADDNDDLKEFRVISNSLQRNILDIFKKMLAVSPPVLQLFRNEGLWNILFSKYFFYFGLEGKENFESQPLQLEVISFLELAASMHENSSNLAECSALVNALEQSSRLPCMATMLLKSLHRILQVCPETTSISFRNLQVVVVLSEVMATQLHVLRDGVENKEEVLQCRDAAFSLFNECLSISEHAKSVALKSTKLMDILFSMIPDATSRSFAIHHVSNFMKLTPSSEADQDAKMELCMKYLETLSRVQSDLHASRIHVILDLLSILRDVLQSDFPYYQALFREVECFVHIVSLLNEGYSEEGKHLCLEVIATLIHLLKGNEASKLAFRSLVGPGYKMLEKLLLDCYGEPNESLICALLDMLVDGKFEIPGHMLIQNEDVIILIFNIIRLCNKETQLRSLSIFLEILEESTANKSSCVRAGLLCLLLDWFSSENDDVVLQKVGQFMRLVGGHSMAGKEMRKIFSLLRNTMNSDKSKNSLLLNIFKSMLREQGPSVFFELNGKDSGIVISTPLKWPTNKGYTFLCWIRMESFHSKEVMGLYSFLTENGKGSTALLSSSKLIIEVESTNHKRQVISTEINIELKKWHFICITHSSGRALSTGSVCKIYTDGNLIYTEKLRYPKVYDPLTRCTIGATAPYSDAEGNIVSSSALHGQLGPVYLFDEVLTVGQVNGVFQLGPGYINSFLQSEVGYVPTNVSEENLFSSKEGLSSKMVFGYNALANSGRNLFDIKPVSEENTSHEATIMTGTQLCYRSLVQNNIHCVGGIPVFFPLVTSLRQPLTHSHDEFDDYYLVDVVELLDAVVANNYANLKYLQNSRGLSLLGFLLQFVSIKQLSVKVISALNTLVVTLAESNDRKLSEILVDEAILKIYMNTYAWIYSPYVIQRELYLSLINFLENHNHNDACSLSTFLDIIHHFYYDKPKSRRASKTIFATGDRPKQEELSQLRILVLSLAEGAIRHRISLSDTKCLISFIDKSDDLMCVEEVLQMLLGLLAEYPDFLSSFLENIHILGGFHLFVNLLKRQQEAIRLLALHILGVLLLVSPAERKSVRIFGLAADSVNKPKGYSSLWFSLSEHIPSFPLTNALRITLFDILLGAALPKQILQGGILTQFGKSSDKRAWLRKLESSGNPAHTSTFPQFIMPRIICVLLRFPESAADSEDILRDILSMLEKNPANAGLLVQEMGWQEWFLSVYDKHHNQSLIRNILCTVHVHAVLNLKGGWRQIEKTFSYIRLHTDQNLMYDLLDDIVEDVMKYKSSHSLQPCRDNVLYTLSLVEELCVMDAFQYLPFSSTSTSEETSEDLLSGSYVDVAEDNNTEDERKKAKTPVFKQRLYDNAWNIVWSINSPSSPAYSGGPSLGQRARGLVESLNIPAAEVAAVVTGSVGMPKLVEKAMKLRGEKFSRLAFRLVLVYLYRASLEAVFTAVQQFLSLVRNFLSQDSDQTKAQLHLLLWCLLDARKQIGNMDDESRYHIISQLIQELLEIGKIQLATSLTPAEASSNIPSESSAVYSLLQQDKVIALVKEDRKYLRTCKRQWESAVESLSAELNESRELDTRESKTAEEHSQNVLSTLYNAELSRRADAQVKHDADVQAIAGEWCLIYRNLTDERGPWSSTSFPNTNPTWWKLDKTEDPLRRRIKLKRNYHFDPKLLEPPASTSTSAQNIPKNMPSKVGLRSIISFKESEEEEEMQDANEEFENEPTSISEELNNTLTTEEDTSETKQSNTVEDEVLLSVCCVLISPKQKLAGRLEITHVALNFHGEFSIEGTAGSMVFNPTGGFNDNYNINPETNNMKQHRKWDMSQITAIYATRYLLQQTALEIFFACSAPPVFLNFHTHQVAKEVAAKIAGTTTDRSKGKSNGKERNHIYYVDRRKAIELAEKARDAWRRREYSNFEYLMILNTLASRTYNDLTQYPIFPWILSDYSSEVLDLSNPSVYRDLSKPVGALDEKRFKVFEERYNNFSDPDIPSFYYGSHYSSMGIVLFYLLRLEPFSTLHRILQGGKFDHADRLFHSIQSAYSNCLTNTSDVKEVIPEFYYMPEFLTNTNNYYIGVKQDGQQLNNVILPPWSKGSPEEFIRLNREALESEHVSENLHHWIDLIFGYKQRGRPAVEAANLFYYLTYEGTVDLERMDDIQQRASVEDQIANFGQTPVQLFKKKHPKRGPGVPLLRPLYYSPASITLTSSISSRYLSSENEDSSIIYISHTDGKITSITSKMNTSTRTWLTPSVQAGGSFTFSSSSQESTYGVGSEVYPSFKMRGYFAESFTPASSCFSSMQVNSSMYLITCGHWDNSFKLISLHDGRISQSNYQHKDVVTCVSVAGSVAVTGSRDTTVMVWDAITSTSKRQQKDMVISDKPRHVLCGHDDAVTCVVVRVELDLVVSGSRDGTCILYTLRQGRYVRSLVHPYRKSISLLAVSQHGHVVFYSNEDLNMFTFSVNGKKLAEAELNGRLNCMQVSSCGEYLLSGGEQGLIFLRKIHSLDIVHRYDCAGSAILCISVTPEDCFLVGTRDGKVLIFAVATMKIR